MALVIKLLMTIFISNSLYALQIVPFIPKDHSSSLLYQSSDDQTRYLSQNQNTLFLMNAATKIELLKTTSKLSSFIVSTSLSKKNVLVEVDESPFLNLNPNKNKSIYFGGYKEKTINLLGTGSNAKLHLEDQWASFFDASRKVINFEFLQLLGKNHYSISLNNKISTYFVPEVSFVEHEQVLYTDINDKGEEALISYNLKTQNFVFLHKTVGPGKIISHCLLNKEVIIAEFDLNSQPKVNIYSMVYQGDRIFSEKKNYYADNNKYHPKIVCNLKDSNVLMLKTTTPPEKQVFSTENSLIILYVPKLNVVELPLDHPFSQIFTMDERILLQSSGRIYQVVK